MITAVDTSVLLDVFKADPIFGTRSRDALRSCIREGRVVVCEVVLAEIGSAFPTGEEARRAMQALGIELEPMSMNAALAAGDAFRACRARGGRRERVVADFLIEAHAQEHAERLLTRDRGFHRTYFTTLNVLDPSTRVH